MKKIAMVKTRYGAHKAVFEPETDMGGYSAVAPSVQGAVSWGRNLAQAKKMVAEAIELAIEMDVLQRAEKRGAVRIIRTHKKRGLVPA
jgi:predicted RNase H-like HicB family nuclease